MISQIVSFLFALGPTVYLHTYIGLRWIRQI